MGSGVLWVVYAEAPQVYKEPMQAEACAAWLVEVLEEAAKPKECFCQRKRA